MINRDTWGRMVMFELFDILTYRMRLRFELRESRHVDGDIKLPISQLGMKAARIMWADRAEAAFDLEAQSSGIHQPSAAFIDYPHDWKRDAREMGK